MIDEHSEYEEQLDAVLRAIGTAAPDPAMEGRILHRLAAARTSAEPGRFVLGRRVPRFVAPLAGFASAGLVCGVIVVGSVRHSHELHRAGEPAAVPVLPMQGGGVGAASAVRPADPGTAAPVPASPAARGKATHRTAQRGRARIARQAKKAPGVTVPVPARTGSPQP
jgi:hypothetical protein